MSRELLALKHGGDRHFMPDLRLYISTTGRLQPEERQALINRIAPNLVDYYGSTGGGLVTFFSTKEANHAPTSVGRPALGVEVEIVDDVDRPLRAGKIGRIRIRGPGVTTRFAGDFSTADEGIHHGWYYPGDIGHFDEDGYLYLLGRTADLIKRGGLMVHAQEVERVLQAHEAVLETAVVGIPSAELGESVAAFVTVTRPVESRELVFHCRRNLAPYKVPGTIEIVESLPRNANGKILKSELRPK
jgi:acyl-coenzyme A synthetase/AMP-(fatty) acid ligase